MDDKRPSSPPAPPDGARAKDRYSVISAGDAWEAFGSDPEFEPRRKSSPANGRCLWILNQRRLLVLRVPVDVDESDVSHLDEERDEP